MKDELSNSPKPLTWLRHRFLLYGQMHRQDKAVTLFEMGAEPRFAYLLDVETTDLDEAQCCLQKLPGLCAVILEEPYHYTFTLQAGVNYFQMPRLEFIQVLEENFKLRLLLMRAMSIRHSQPSMAYE